jgi:hypothetical protein
LRVGEDPCYVLGAFASRNRAEDRPTLVELANIYSRSVKNDPPSSVVAVDTLACCARI